ncbi:hypothetical protein IWX48DRAFT_606717 [Phyllosticta citricarpa]
MRGAASPARGRCHFPTCFNPQSNTTSKVHRQLHHLSGAPMAALRSLSATSMASLAPRLGAPLAMLSPVLRRTQQPLMPASLRLPAPAVAAITSISGILSDIWESILRAVPKKKTSHMKKRIRQYANKGLKDVTEIVSCPGCGRPKRAHILCPYCVKSIQKWLKKKSA